MTGHVITKKNLRKSIILSCTLYQVVVSINYPNNHTSQLLWFHPTVNTRFSNSSGCLCVRMNICIIMWWLSWQYFMNLWCTRSGGLGSSVGLVWSCLWTDQILPNCWEHKYIYIPDTLHVHTNTIRQSIWLPTGVKSCRIFNKMQLRRHLLNPPLMVLCPGSLQNN
jgi:hypothetical protein